MSTDYVATLATDETLPIHEIVEIEDETALICDEGPSATESQYSLGELGYKCHTADTGVRAIERMKYTPYDLVLVAENFAGSSLETNPVLQYLKPLPMAQRRNTFVVAIGDSFRTLDAMQAYANSVHLVINPSELANIAAILKKGLAEFNLLYRAYKRVQAEIG